MCCTPGDRTLAVPSPHPLRRFRWRYAFLRWLLASLQNRFLSAGSSALDHLQGQVPRSDETSKTVRSNPTRALADRLERQLPSGGAPVEATLKYLAPYVFKVAISNSRIVGVHDRTVLIRYRKSHSERSRILALDVMEFIRRFLQHVLPTGFMKIRYYGFMNPNCRGLAGSDSWPDRNQLRFRCRFAPTRCRASSSQHLSKLRRSAQTTLGSAVSQYFVAVGIRANSFNPIGISVIFPVRFGSKGMRRGAPRSPIALLRRCLLRGNRRRKILNLSKLYRCNFTARRFTAPI